MSVYIPLVLAILGFAFLLFFLGYSFKGKFSILKYLFVFTSLWIAVAGVSILFVFLDEEESGLGAEVFDSLRSHVLGAYKGVFWTALTLSAFFIVGFLIILIRVFMLRKKPESEVEWEGLN